jgi:hypothetical protein
MQNRLLFLVLFLVANVVPARAASDADVTLLKVSKVEIMETEIIIEVSAAITRITLIKGGHDPAYKGDTWMGMPVSRVPVISNRAVFRVQRPSSAAPGGSLTTAWADSLKAARALKEGGEVGRIGYYAPDIVIKGNRIESISGPGFLYPKG